MSLRLAVIPYALGRMGYDDEGNWVPEGWRTRFGSLGVASTLVRLGGADPRRVRTSGDRARYVTAGATLLTTAIISGLGMALFLSTSLDGSAATFTPIALLWALFILAFDRQIITSPIQLEQSDGGVEGASSTQKLKSAWKSYLARFFLAVLIAFFVSESFTQRLFEDEVEREVSAIVSERVGDLEQEVRDRPEFANRAEELEQIAERAENGEIPERFAANAQIAQRRLNRQIAAEITELRPAAEEIGFLDEQLALWRATTGNAQLVVTRLLVTLLIMVIELAPIILKVWSGATAYDYSVYYEQQAEIRRVREAYDGLDA